MTRTREAQWVSIREFPNYEISSDGEVYNLKTRQLMRRSRNNFGYAKITLTAWDGSRHTRSVALMVAEAFVRSPNIMCDHVIVLDGDLDNVAADNLAWRPRGFAREYFTQLRAPQPRHYQNLPICNVTLDLDYESVIDAGTTEGLLFKDVWRSTYTGQRIFPHGHVFEVI